MSIHYLPTWRPDWSSDAHGVLDAVEELLASGCTSDVITFCELAVAYLEANADDIEDPAPLVRLGQRLGELLTRAATTTARPPRRTPTPMATA
jgi:hypothetical protein